MQLPSACLATIVINEETDLEHGQITVFSNNVMELQRYTSKIVFNGVICLLLVCAVAFIIYEHHGIIGDYLQKIDYI